MKKTLILFLLVTAFSSVNAQTSLTETEIKQKCDSKKDLIYDLMYHIADVATVCYKRKSININIINNK